MAKLGSEIGKRIGGAMIEKMVERNNFILFSLGRITFMEKSKIVSVGVLGNVFVLKNLDEGSEMSLDGAGNGYSEEPIPGQDTIEEGQSDLNSLSWKNPDRIYEEINQSYNTIYANLSRFKMVENRSDYMEYVLDLATQKIIFSEGVAGAQISLLVDEDLRSIIGHYKNLGLTHLKGEKIDWLHNTEFNYCLMVSKETSIGKEYIRNDDQPPFKIDFLEGNCDRGYLNDSSDQ
jgi:hypothetical protein